MNDSYYDDQAYIHSLVEKGNHRAAIGGHWDRIGKLQFDTAVQAGLKPHHRLVDVGCGSLRGGVQFIPYLDPGHYFGTDVNASLIEAGRDIELDAEARARVPMENFCVSEDFRFDFGEARFDFAMAVSLFTHLRQNTIELCLRRLRPRMVPGGLFQATFFPAPEGAPDTGLEQRDGIVTFPHKDPYHYTLDQIATMARRTGWQFRWVGEFGHPRGQNLAEFIAADPDPLPVGNRVDMATQDGDLVASSGFRLLCTLGLRASHAVLELAPAQTAPLLRPYLAQGRHLVAAPDSLPALASDDAAPFDFILARDPAALPLPDLRDLLVEQGLLLLALPLQPAEVRPLMREAGLVGRRLPWEDAGLHWYAMGRTPRAVPGPAGDAALTGHLLRRGG